MTTTQCVPHRPTPISSSYMKVTHIWIITQSASVNSKNNPKESLGLKRGQQPVHMCKSVCSAAYEGIFGLEISQLLCRKPSCTSIYLLLKRWFLTGSPERSFFNPSAHTFSLKKKRITSSLSTISISFSINPALVSHVTQASLLWTQSIVIEIENIFM